MADKTTTMLQQVSDIAWLVHQGEKKLGILNKDVQETYTFLTGKETVVFTNDSEVRKHFGNLSLFEVQIDEPAQVQDTYYLNGHAVNYPTPHVIDYGHQDYRHDLPLYSKIEGSDIYYAAGYYCINFEKGWKIRNGPKLSTLLKYGYEGPFKTDTDAKLKNKQLNKAAKK